MARQRVISASMWRPRVWFPPSSPNGAPAPRTKRRCRACSPTSQILRDAVLTGARRLKSIILKSLNCPRNLIIRQHDGRSGQRGEIIDFCERLQLDGSPQCFVQVGARDNRSMIPEQDAARAPETWHGMVGQFGGSVRRVICTTDSVVAERRDHVVRSRNIAPQYGKSRRVKRMRMYHCIHIPSRTQDVAMEAPFCRGLKRPLKN